MNEALPYIAVGMSALTLIILVVEKVFGGGNALANKFHALEKDTAIAIAGVRREMDNRVDNYVQQSTVGFESMKSGIVEMKMALMEFRANMAENLHSYIRKDEYNSGIGEIKMHVQDGFRTMESRMGQLQDLILYVNPEAAERLK